MHFNHIYFQPFICARDKILPFFNFTFNVSNNYQLIAIITRMHSTSHGNAHASRLVVFCLRFGIGRLYLYASGLFQSYNCSRDSKAPLKGMGKCIAGMRKWFIVKPQPNPTQYKIYRDIKICWIFPSCWRCCGRHPALASGSNRILSDYDWFTSESCYRRDFNRITYTSPMLIYCPGRLLNEALLCLGADVCSTPYRLVHERRNSSALAMELRLSCTNPSIFIYSASNISGTDFC